MRLAKDLLGCKSDLLRLLTRTNHMNLSRWNFVRIPRLTVNCEQLHNSAFEIAADHASGENLLGGTSDLLRLIARTNRVKFKHL